MCACRGILKLIALLGMKGLTCLPSRHPFSGLSLPGQLPGAPTCVAYQGTRILSVLAVCIRLTAPGAVHHSRLVSRETVWAFDNNDCGDTAVHDICTSPPRPYCRWSNSSANFTIKFTVLCFCFCNCEWVVKIHQLFSDLLWWPVTTCQSAHIATRSRTAAFSAGYLLSPEGQQLGWWQTPRRH